MIMLFDFKGYADLDYVYYSSEIGKSAPALVIILKNG